MSSSRSPRSRAWPCAFLSAVLVSSTLVITAHPVQLGQVPTGGTFIVFGRVNLPNGRPATSRMKVFLEGSTGIQRDILTDDDGKYEFRQLPRGRYRIYAINPGAPEQYCDPIEADTNRSYANRLQVDINLKLPLHKGDPNAKAGSVSVAEARQEIPRPARRAYDEGVKLQKANRADEALAQFNDAIDLYPGYFQAVTERANLFMQRGNLAEAETGFLRALELNREYAPALRGIGYCQIQQKKFASAVSYLEKAFVLDPNEPLGLLLLGYGNMSMGRYEEAKQCLQQALKLGPQVAVRAYVHLAETHAKQQNFQEAADAIRTYLRLKPDVPDAKQLKELETQWRAQIKPPAAKP